MNSDTMLGALPTPKPGQAGRFKLVIAAALAIILLAGLGFWLTRDEESKKDILARTEGALSGVGLDPLVNATKELLTPPSPPPHVHSVGLAAPGISANGTLIQGTVPAPADLSAAEKASNMSAANQDASATLPGVMPQQREDSVIRPDFVRDLAVWLVTRYKPAPQGGKGQINVSIQAANMRYGANMRGMERQGKDPAGARAHLLHYAFNPTMLGALYGIYADRLVDEVAQAALAPDQGKALSEAQLNDLYKTYAAFLADFAGVTGGIAAMPDLKERIQAVNSANQQTIALHRQITENVFALDEAREKQDNADIAAIEARIATLNGRYRSALQGQGNARAALIAAVRKSGPAPRLDDDSVYFLALWVERRMDKQPDALDTARKASSLLGDLSRRFEQAGSVPQKSAKMR